MYGRVGVGVLEVGLVGLGSNWSGRGRVIRVRCVSVG